MTRNDFNNLVIQNNFEVRNYDLIKLIDESDNETIKKIISEVDNNVIGKIEYKKRAVLGLDFYGYSKFEKNKQTLIPFVFDLIYQETIHNICDYENCFFEGYSFEDNFISTGDGCYQLFDNPIQAFIFNANFYVSLHRYNAFRFYPKFRAYVGELLVRSCITFDDVFSYDKESVYQNDLIFKNYYGPAIIHNARILSKDKLNRFLIDDNTNKWFLSKIDGVENLSSILFDELIEILELEDWGHTAIFRTAMSYKDTGKEGREYGYIKSCVAQKIGNVMAKSEMFSIYNLTLQLYVYIFDPGNRKNGRGMIVSMGNSNNTGLSE